jgi:polar amino acid transport system substrate-binding protein
MFAAHRRNSGDPRQTNADLAEIWISNEKVGCKPARGGARPLSQTSALHCYYLCDNRQLSDPTIKKMRMTGYGNPSRMRRLACALLLLAGNAAAAQLTARVMAQESIPPKWILEDGIPQGLCPDVFAAIERVEPRIRFAGYDRGRSILVIEDALASGKVSAACGLVDSPRRRSVALRSQFPLYQVRHRLAAVAGDAQVVNSLADLAQLKALVNTARGSGYIARLKELGIPVDDSTGDNVVNLHKIMAGHGRYTYMNELSLVHLIRSEHLEDKVRMLPAVLNEEPLYFWVSRKADPALAPLLDQALGRLKANGELARIYDRWASLK